MEREFWNKRYSEPGFAYGILPNLFLKEYLELLDKKGKALFLGEGEGRNAVYAAKQGWQVDAVDYSFSAKKKADLLAAENQVNINFVVNDLSSYNFKENYYDLVVIIFLHLTPDMRNHVFVKSILSLKKYGNLLLEVFSKEQINNNSGGPRSIDLLYSETEIVKLTRSLKTELIETKKIDLSEGIYHKGIADVVRYIGIKE